MTEESYARWSAPLRARPAATHTLLAVNKLLTYAGYVAYPLLLVLLAVQESPLLARCVVVPAALFAAVSAFRRAVNAPRPYEALDIVPLISKNTRGKSFPSRHTFSFFTIAAAWWLYAPVVGCVLMIAGAALGVVRVLGGVHFPRDVAAGATSALVLSFAGYALIPWAI